MANDSVSGAFTFLFTDIEGSTHLWDEQPEIMSEALHHHDRSLRSAIEAHSGRVVSTAGDAFSAVFVDPASALLAALSAQRILSGLPFRVRMALHTGVAEEREGDYFGPVLNRTARLRDAAHGGQIVLSLGTEEMVRERLPDGAALRDLGEQRLRDLTHPERVFQLLHPDLPTDFPPLRTLNTRLHNLPIQVTSFVGRDSELKEVADLLRANRLVTLTGVGGTGKTRLALQVTAEAIADYPEGAWLVELAALTDPDLLPQVTASVLGMRPHPGRSLLELLVDGLMSQKLLLVLDNCEHLLESAAYLADTLLHSCPGVSVLATSREGLGVAGEVAYPVPSLSLPDGETEDVAASESGRLFAERAASAKPSFTLTPEDAQAVSRICHRLDGIPLAIELAAARVRALSPAQLAEQLERSFRILTGGSRAALPRQRTLEASIRWSHELLSPSEQKLLRQLSVFSGSFTLDAVESVYGADGVELLLNLVDKSLVVPEEIEGEVRYRLLEAIRTFAAERLVEAGEGEDLRREHARFFLDLAQQAQPEVLGPDQKRWLDRLEADHENLRAALEWSVETDLAGIALPLTSALVGFWFRRGHWTAACGWLDRLLSCVGDLVDPRLALLMSEAADLFGTQGKIDRCLQLAARGLELAEQTGDEELVAWAKVLQGDGLVAWRDDTDRGIPLMEEGLAVLRKGDDRGREAEALYGLGAAHIRDGNVERALPLIEEAAAQFKTQGDHWKTANNMSYQASVLRRLGRFEEAARLAEESVRLHRSLDAEVMAAHSLYNFGFILIHLEDYGRAGEALEEAVSTLRKAGDLGCRVHVLAIQAFLALRQGQLTHAKDLLVESLDHARDREDPWFTAYSLNYLARVMAGSESPEAAARLIGAAQSLRRVPIDPADEDEHHQLLENLRARLREDGLAQALGEGKAMSLQEAIEYGLTVAR